MDPIAVYLLRNIYHIKNFEKVMKGHLNPFGEVIYGTEKRKNKL